MSERRIRVSIEYPGSPVVVRNPTSYRVEGSWFVMIDDFGNTAQETYLPIQPNMMIVVDIEYPGAGAEPDPLRVAVTWAGINGAHHKDWVIDQMVRALLGADYDAWRIAYESKGNRTWPDGVAP